MEGKNSGLTRFLDARSQSAGGDLLQFVEMDTFGSKLQQKALQQPKQKKSKSAEFLMGESSAAVGIENPAFDGGRSAKLCVPLVWLGIEIRGDRPDSTLAAHQKKKMELQAPAKERGDERAQNYFDPSLAQQIDPRHCRMAGVSTEDELELTILKADENRLYRRTAILLEEGDTFIDIPGTLQASRDEKVLEVKTGDPVLQQRPLLHGGGHASGSRPSQTHTVAKPLDEASAGLGGEAGLEAGRMIMGRESTVKMRIAEEAIPHNAQQLREPVQSDMITLGSLSLQQEPYSPRDSDEAGGKVPQPRLNTLLECRTIESPSRRVQGEGQEEAVAKFDQMTKLPESSISASQSMWQVNQSMTPQHVELCLCCLRATREKLPRGLYTVSVTLYSHLGGSALVRCGKKEQQRWTVSTEPVEHRGNFYDTDLLINQNLFMILPAAREVVPCMVLIFQLIALGGDRSHISSIVAWGAFPVCGPNLSLVQGRFKTPLLRGEPNAELDQFKKIESLISSDLDHWLCNVYFQVKMLPSGAARGPEPGITLPMPPPNSPVISKPGVQLDHPHSQLQLQSQPLTTSQLCPQSQIYDQQHNHAGPSSRVGDAAVVYSERGSPLHLSADSACSSSSLPGKNSSSGAISGNTGEKCDPCRLKAEGGIHHKKKPIKKTNSCGPSMSSSSAPPRQADKQKMQPSMENLSTEELEEYTFSLQSALKGPRPSPSRLSDRARLALRMLPSDLGLPLLGQQQQRHASWRGCVWRLSLIMLLMALMWFVRLYLHYCSQWLYLQAIAVPVNKFEFHTHTVELIYQSSLLHIWEEMAMLVVGPLTLNTLTFLLVLIRWGCQQIFGSLPSFTSKFIMAQGVWTVLDPLAVFAVDAVLGRLSYSPDTPVGDAAKLYWHFHRTGQSGAAGVVITLFLYAVLFLLSVTILSVYLLRFHNDGHMLDIFQRLTAKEGTYFLPEDLELSNQELSYIVKKAEQWRGFNGERRNVVVYDHIRTAEDPLPGSSLPSGDGPSKQGAPQPEAETSTHVVIYTLYPSGLKQRYRHFLRQSDGAIIEVIGDIEGVHNMTPCAGAGASNQREGQEAEAVPLQLRKRNKLFGRSNRVEPIGGSRCGSNSALQDLNQ
ncbi:LOW QUALITY PROTEIN: uncharacterized protein ofcc1 [Echeneis naucrates]|uniref:LOW QUALITY PROTEIN: uncharacterized protein ofcc1 n=1 Tax=Echeneis naucrates TaxID=173247 RepID=UPI001113D24A|nr:LOW QUALITY PROTEIN: orofacial cleft 1 candidate gene 1 protein [Echeneis naucrates]